MRSSACFGRHLTALALGFLMSSASIFAGGSPEPLIVALDGAKLVVVGKIIKMAETSQSSQGWDKYVEATIKVTQTLKGEQSDTVCCTVKEGGNSGKPQSEMPAAVFSSHYVGEEGIWVISPDRELYWGSDSIQTTRLNDVKRQLDLLNNRVWSQSVNGLRVWAAELPGSEWPNKRFVFAVQGVWAWDILLPNERLPGIMTVDAYKGSRKVFSCDQCHGCKASEATPKSGRTLRHGTIAYLCLQSSALDCKGLPPGDYKVIVTLNSPASAQDSRIWQGPISAPPVFLKGPSHG